ncbi:DUF1045 domain-containing protein [Granulosicoccus sp. 3-233]|uniref:DUF1045 domain-containing protein n=1 Tax=Granulosicoccus sp. 3-233 TaxID=3417969 RepID=UPI003D350FB3
MSTRYALYFAPHDESQLARFGETVLGRTATQPRQDDVPSPHPDRQRWLELTKSPAHYGFHATLKAPFELAEGYSIEDLRQQVEEFAKGQAAIPLTGLRPRRLSDFAALTLDQQPASLSRFAMRVVETFEPFRRALSEADLQRRRQQPLSDRQLTLLNRFGYPYVDEEFRFHMTLTGGIGEQDQDYLDWLQDSFRQQVDDTPLLDQLAIHEQSSRTAPFVSLHSYPLSSS